MVRRLPPERQTWVRTPLSPCVFFFFFFSRFTYTSDLKYDVLVATLPDASRFRVRTGWPGLSAL